MVDQWNILWLGTHGTVGVHSLERKFNAVLLYKIFKQEKHLFNKLLFSWPPAVFFQPVFSHWLKCFWNDWKKLSHFSHNVWKYRLMDTVMVSFNINVRQMHEMSQQKWLKCLSEKKQAICQLKMVHLKLSQRKRAVLSLSSEVKKNMLAYYVFLVLVRNSDFVLFSLGFLLKEFCRLVQSITSGKWVMWVHVVHVLKSTLTLQKVLNSILLWWMLMVLASLKFGILSLCNTTGITLHWVTCFDICILYTSTLHFRLHSQKLENLDTNHVDTGMGLERITAILQNKSSNYDTDLFIPIISKLEEVNILVFFALWEVLWIVVSDVCFWFFVICCPYVIQWDICFLHIRGTCGGSCVLMNKCMLWCLLILKMQEYFVTNLDTKNQANL